ncbi:hypothetical protein B9G55_10355 [Saccharibacillus sp. O16]|nr:hypothetical protein B9G55_10355 [Saccharibacillus sp. O16]
MSEQSGSNIAFSPKRIAILGATGHIAKNVMLGLSVQTSFVIYAFSQSVQRLSAELERLHLTGQIQANDYSEFPSLKFDVVINCTGIGNPKTLASDASLVFRVTETFDALVLDYLDKHPNVLYINCSSGAVYGNRFDKPAGADHRLSLDINGVNTSDYYGIAKLNAEAKHRSLSHLSIIDLRIFGFFSAWIDPDSSFLLMDLVNAARNNTPFLTTSENMYRDYVHPEDLTALILLCIYAEPQNRAFDVYSKQPISKNEILDFFVKTYGVRIQFKETSPSSVSVTGLKPYYYSLDRSASERLAYNPEFSSLQSISQTCNLLIQNT